MHRATDSRQNMTRNDCKIPLVHVRSELSSVTRVSVFFSDEQPLWFLHRERFCATVASSTRIPEQAHPALLASVCALGARNNTAGDLTALAPVLLNIALSSINQRLDSDELHYAHSALQLIQARVLLGGLLMSSGQALQGATLLSGACSLTLTLGLHNPYATVGGIAVVPVPMGRPLPPMNGVEAAEGAGAFWVTATLDRLWALALGKRPRVNLDALEVHTAWFKRPEFYGQVCNSLALHLDHILIISIARP